MIFAITHWDSTVNEQVDHAVENYKSIQEICVCALLEVDSSGLKDPLSRLLDLSIQHNIPITVLSLNPFPLKTDLYSDDPRYSNVQYIAWPTFFMSFFLSKLLSNDLQTYYQQFKADFSEINTTQLTSNFRYTYVCLNKARKRHRSIMMDMLAKNDLINHGAITWRSIPKTKDEITYMIPYEFEYWKEEPLFLDQIDNNSFFKQEQLPPDYFQSFMQVVTESNIDQHCLSEKTMAPLIFSKPFLAVSSVGYHQFLKSLGFLLYEELFDYSFDSVEDVTERCDLIAQNVKRYIGKSDRELGNLYLSIQEKLLYNKKLALKLSSDTSKFPNIWNELAKKERGNVGHLQPREMNNKLNELYVRFFKI